jgi:hypothetical protein
VVEFQPLSSVSVYELQWAEYPHFWEGDNKRTTRVTVSSPGKKTKAEATNLNPGATFSLRLVCVDNDSGETIGEPGPELVIDTEQVGCTPKPGRGCCTIL